MHKVFAIVLLVAVGVCFWLYQKGNKDINPAIISEREIISIDNKEKNMNLTLHTNKGDITIELFDELTPKTVENFRKLAQSGFYDGVKFHRVIKDFMIQGGDPLTKDDSKKAYWGTGGPGYSFADEISESNKNSIGTISMANAGPNTNGSQFFINLKDNNFLDTKHTVFGKVVVGMEVAKTIESTPVDGSDRPIDPVMILNITAE
ncbi:MAG: peptidyl-prolyl cis-trans isomerase B (cyclophilin B) [Parcubacteria bacterium C7867-005]|nr:MAG: peptidyl-prolyl cis-trans isomerase B (cyclophilin B) [Parcubacteria bacterium C7867-005]